jgi:hypothetical protein
MLDYIWAVIIGVAVALLTMLCLPQSASAVGLDYICGDYSIVIEPKDRTFTSFDGNTQTTSTVFVPKGITVYDDKSGDKWTVKTLPRNKHGKVAVRGKTCSRAQ